MSFVIVDKSYLDGSSKSEVEDLAAKYQLVFQPHFFMKFSRPDQSLASVASRNFSEQKTLWYFLSEQAIWLA